MDLKRAILSITVCLMCGLWADVARAQVSYADSPLFPLDTRSASRDIAFGESGGFTLKTPGANRAWADADLVLDLPPVLPHVLANVPSGPADSSIDHFDLLFDKLIEPATFDADDVVLTRLSGERITVGNPRQIRYNAWRVSFPAQSALGQYRIRVGPHISDTGGHDLDQDHDDRPGEDPDDLYQGSFTTVHVTPLVIGMPVNDRFSATEQSSYYSIDVNEGKELAVELVDADNVGTNELYASFAELPTRDKHQHRAPAGVLADRTLSTRGTRPGKYYILAYNTALPESPPSEFSILAEYRPLKITAVKPAEGYNADSQMVSSTIFGTALDKQATVVLRREGLQDIPAVTRTWVDTGTFFASFTVLNANPGSWNVVVSNPDGQTASYPFTIQQGGKPELKTNLLLPSAVGWHVPSTLYIEYENVGSGPMPAPLFKLYADHGAHLTAEPALAASFQAEGPVPPGFSDTVQVMALGQNPYPSVLKPGDKGRIPIYWRGAIGDPTYPPITFGLSVLTSDNGTPIDWATLKTQMTPDSLPADAWEAVFSNLSTQLGLTWGDYVIKLGADAAYLQSVGESVIDVPSLLAFEMLQASGLSPHRTLAGSVEAYSPAPGIPLVFTRSFGQNIDSRYRLGPLGRGWTHNWDVRVSPQSNGSVRVKGPNGLDRLFTTNSYGGFKGTPGEFGTLTNSGDAYRLTEKDGTAWQFRPDNLLDYVQDTNANRITCVYTGTQLTTLNHSCGKSLTLTYTGDRLTELTDAAGRDTIFTYDGEHLASVTAPGNRVTFYTHDTSGTLPKQHALLSVTHPGGTHDYFTYDDQGRLTETHRDGNSESVSYAYGPGGKVTVTDAANRQTDLYFGSNGQLQNASDGQGSSLGLAYDVNHQLSKLAGSEGQNYAYAYDPSGNIVGTQDPLSHVTNFNYAGPSGFNRLTSFTDARNNGIHYGYNSAGTLTSITYQDGKSETFTYDAQGNVLTWTNRRGQTVTYNYNSLGQVTSKDYSNTPGVDFQYTYQDGRLTSATDSTGTTSMTYDPATDRLTRIDYPGGKYFTFQYDDASRRTRRDDQDGYVEKYVYDAAGRLQSIKDGSDTLIIEYIYDSAGQLSRENKGNGTYTTYAYNASGRIEHLINAAPDDSVQSRFDYTYDANGNPLTMDTLSGMWHYGYDATGQLTYVKYPNGWEVTYVYDAVGNRISVADNGSMTSYTSNGLNQYTQVGTDSYTYNDDGDMLTRTDAIGTTQYNYDAENRLVQIITPTDGTWQYTYDALGNRVKVQHNSFTTLYVHDLVGLVNVAAEYNGDGELIARYTHGLGLTARADGTSSRVYYAFDQIGNARQVTGDTGSVVNSYDYDPFGMPLATIEAVTNPFHAVGKYGVMAQGNEVSFMRGRFYSPVVGRFTAMDPLGIGSGSPNLYLYGGNAPIRNVDPTGKILQVIIGGVLVKVVAVTVLGILAIDEIVGITQFGEGPLSGPGDPDGDSLTAGEPVRFPRRGANTPPAGEVWLLPSQPTERTLYVSWGDYEKGVLVRPNTRVALKPTVPLDISFYVPLTSELRKLVRSFDPNDKIGPAGFGDQGFITADAPFPYTVYFENESDASASARRVVVEDQLDTDLKWGTIKLGEIVFGSNRVEVPTRPLPFETQLAIDGWTYNELIGWHTGETPLIAHVLCDVNASGLLTCTLDCWDPITGLPPEDAYAGFLPPNEEVSARGEGHINYIIQPKPGLASGTQITNQANIVFDYNPAILTPTTLHTIDAGAPTSSVKPLPQTTSASPLRVEWTGQDDANGSGISSYDVYVSIDGAPWALWQTTSETSAEFSGQPGHTYAFYSVATDNVGHRESPPAATDAVTGTPIQVPGELTLGTITATTITIANLGTANMGSVEHAIQEQTTGHYVGADGRLTTEPAWKSLDAWAGTIVWGILTPDTEYDFQVKARAVGTETEFGPIVVVITSHKGDSDGDGQAAGTDLALVTAARGSTPGQPAWNPKADLNNDQVVNAQDRKLIQLARIDPDGDGDVDQTDFAHFQTCYTGPAIGKLSGGCADVDFNDDGKVDSGDYQVFVGCAGGPAVPLNPSCID